MVTGRLDGMGGTTCPVGRAADNVAQMRQGPDALFERSGLLFGAPRQIICRDGQVLGPGVDVDTGCAHFLERRTQGLHGLVVGGRHRDEVCG